MIPAVLCLLTGVPVAMAARNDAGQVDTGRHRPQAVAVADTGRAGQPSRVEAAIGVGMLTSGDLLRVRTAAGSGIPWAPPGGSSFVSDEYLLTIDEDVAFSLMVKYDLTRWLAVRADGSTARVSVTAKAHSGEVVNLHQWDTVTLSMLGLAIEGKLVQQPSYPYLLAGVAYVSLSGHGGEGFDQSRLALRFGAGYHHDLGQRLGLRVEARNTLQQFKFSDYVPPVDGAILPNYTIEERGPQQLWELLLGLTGRF